MNWREKTCEKCVFRVDNECRRMPPAILHSLNVDMAKAWAPRYPSVIEIGRCVNAMNGKYIAACAEYAESLDRPDHSCPKCGHGMITSPEHPSRYCTKCGEGY